MERHSDLIVAIEFTWKYDAYNRLTELKQGQTVVAIYEYDALHRRVKKHIDEQSPAGPNGVDVYQHLLCNVRWEVVEARWNHRKGPRGSWA